jgi:hypothetical protein
MSWRVKRFMICTKCGKEKDISRFQKKRNKHSAQCKDCRNEYNRNVWYPKNAEKQKKMAAKWKKNNKARIAATRYNINESDIVNAINKFDGFCDLCGEKTKKTVIDHCHETNKFRGLICHRCNTLLGRLGDSKNSVKIWYKKILDYLN